MSSINPSEIEYALGQIQDGFLFERLSQNFLAKILGYEFIPVGGLKDRGIDGLEHVFAKNSNDRFIYQTSIERDSKGKLNDTLKKLHENNIDFTSLIYVTNQIFFDQEKFIDQAVGIYGVNIRIYDVKWFSSRVNTSQDLVDIYNTFVTSYFHQFNKPGQSQIFADLLDDPRLFVFLRQQLDASKHEDNLEIPLADSLILYALEGTDPDKNIFLSKTEIKTKVSEYIKFEPRKIYPTIDERLLKLSSKPSKRINYHKDVDAYCLPYETRLDIQRKNLDDERIFTEFQTSMDTKLHEYLKDSGTSVKDCLNLIIQTVNKLFHEQGLEFSDFILNAGNSDAVEKNLPDLISSVVDDSSVILKNKQCVKSCLLMAIRDMIYNGTIVQKEYLRRLSNTYMMLFLMHCDPKIATFFGSMASKLKVFVDNSIIIPAMSEYFLEEENRRHFNLLKKARDASVTLIITKNNLCELASHFRMLKDHYDSLYADSEDIYTANETQITYIDEIMIRAYMYSKMRGKVKTFYDYIDTFVTPNSLRPEEEIFEWLKEEFGIKLETLSSLGIQINETESNSLAEKIKSHKSHEIKATADAKTILTVYKLRERNNELNNGGILGYHTWWLSKDTITQKGVNEIFGNKYGVSCYLRPDFLYNYIAMAPTKAEVDNAYRDIFSSFVGVNISFHLPQEVTKVIHDYIKQHKSKNPARVKAIIRDLTEKIKTEPSSVSREYVKEFLKKRNNG